MERSEPSLVPEWLRSNGAGNGSGSSTHHFASSQADGPVLALPRRTRSSKSIGNTDSLHSPLLDRSSSSNSRRSSNSNGFIRHEKNSIYSRPHSSYSRSYRDRDKERSTTANNWDLEYSDPLRGMIGGRVEEPLRRSHSSISRRQDEVPARRMPADIKNGIHKNHDNGNGTHSSGTSVTGVPKVSFERDFPVLGSEDRPKTPDVIRVLSPGLSRSIHSLSIGNPPSVGSETWTSALAEVPSRPGSNGGAGSVPALEPTTAASVSSSSSVSDPTNTSSCRSMAEALVQAAVQPHDTPQLQSDEFALAQSKKLIPMTPLLQKPSTSDKLKKAAVKTNENAVTPKNGLVHLAPLQLGSQPARGIGSRGDCPKSPSSGKLLVLKPGRENGVSPALKDLQSPTAITNNKVGNGPSTANPLKNSYSPKTLPSERKTSAIGSNPGAGIDKRISRSNFFKLMREKSLNNTSGPIGSEPSTSSDVVDKLDKEAKEVEGVQVTPREAGTELKLSSKNCTVADSSSPSVVIDNEEERAFLLSLGWEDNAEGEEEGLTEEEIHGFYIDVMKQCPTSRLCRVLESKIFSHVGCSSSNEANTPTSQTEA